MTFGNGNLPFLPIISRNTRGIYDLMATVQNGGKTGHTYLKSTAISDVVATPKVNLFHIYDVEDGTSTRDKSPEAAREIIKWTKRSPLTCAQMIALTAHTDVLSRHGVWATGSRYRGTQQVPCMRLDSNGRPGLFWGPADSPRDGFGSPSYGSR